MFVVWQTESENTAEHGTAQAELKRSQGSVVGSCTQTRPGPTVPHAEGKNQKTPKRSYSHQTLEALLDISKGYEHSDLHLLFDVSY